jgi:CubicO group peptidase (beta-lactamase class C family)
MWELEFAILKPCPNPFVCYIHTTMQARKMIVRSLWILLIAATGCLIYYCWKSFPILNAYGSKVMCSAVFVGGRNEQQVRDQDLGAYMMKLADFEVNYADSSVTGSIAGFAKRKAIYRSGLGVTLVSEFDEQKIRSQHINLALKPIVNTDDVLWPMGDKMADTFPATIDSVKLRAAVEHVFLEKDTILPVRTRAVVIVYKGQLIAEHYADGFTDKTKLAGWSMTKTVTAALIGILVKQGKLSVDEPAPVPEWQSINDPRKSITIANLLQQRSGLGFEEDYSKVSDATRMLFQKADMGGFTVLHPLKCKPGTVFYYSSGNSNILSRIIRQTLGDSIYYGFPYQQLFYRLGMYSAVIEPDASGTFVGSSYMYATARDWARFGLLYLNDGMFNNARVLPEGWVAKSIVPATAEKKGYGYQIWLNTGSDTSIKRYPAAPADMFYADGFESQLIFIIPSKNLVIVRLGLTQHNNFNGNQFLGEVLASMK